MRCWLVHVRPTGAGVAADGYPVVMATGIVSIAAGEQQYRVLALLLGVLATAVFGLLSVMVGIQGRRAGVRLRDPDLVLRSFSVVAACAVLAARWRTGSSLAAWAMGAVAAGSWAILAVRALFALRSRSVIDLRAHARGAWLLVSVACQSLAVIAADLVHGAATRPLLALALVCWALGLLSYLALATLIIGRALRDRCPPRTPDSWILMGALAIATVAASTITEASRALHGADWTAALTRPAVPALWALASGWIPVLMVTQARRLIPALHHNPARWAAVFPIGMYSVATASLATQLHVTALNPTALVIFWVALAAWTLSAAGLTVHPAGHDPRGR